MGTHTPSKIGDMSATAVSDDSLADGRSLEAQTCELILPSLIASSTNCKDCIVVVFDST